MSKKKSIAASLAAVTLATLTVSHAFAQVAPSQNGIGAQIQATSQEASQAFGFVGSMCEYGGALFCFVCGVWALWESYKPHQQNNGKRGMAFAGIVLCGLFAAGGAWINKAANTTSGANASATSQAGVITFGGQ